MDLLPRVIENREFVEYEEEDIQRLNWEEAEKFERNPQIKEVENLIQKELGPSGQWEEHWLTVDTNGRRVYARIYYTAGKALAITSDGHILREINYPQEEHPLIH